MHDILFKAKRIDNGEWVKGSFITGVFLRGGHDIPYILCPDKADYYCFGDFNEENGIFEVDPETVCQYTGLIDKNGKKIWENDIIKFKHGGEFSENGIYFRNYVVEFINTYVTYGLRLRNKSIHFPFKQATASMHDAEVIGNVFDNPKLLGGEVND